MEKAIEGSRGGEERRRRIMVVKEPVRPEKVEVSIFITGEENAL